MHTVSPSAPRCTAVKITWRVVLKSLEKFSFTEKELELYHAHFETHGLSRKEFHALLKSGAEWRRGAASGEVLQTEGQPVRDFVLLYSGEVVVSSGDTVLATLGPGNLVGETSFALRQVDRGDERTGSAPPRGRNWAALKQSVIRTRATATVTTLGPVEYVAWPVSRLQEALAKSSSVKACLMTIIAVALAEKLKLATKKIDVVVSRRDSSIPDIALAR
eukprot:4241278-Prymnesium_polylepis.1